MTYLEEGTYTFTSKNGANFTIYASPYTPACGDWAFAYDHNQDRSDEPHQVANRPKSIAKHPIPVFPNIDIIMTHGPPKGILDMCPRGIVGCPKLLQALRRARPWINCFGRIHKWNGVKSVDWRPEDSNTGNGSKRT